MIYLFLNSISTGEVIIILIFILIFFGSKNIPGMARSLGKGLRQLRDATDDIKRDIRSSVDDIERDVKANMDKVNIKKEFDDVMKRPARFVNDNIKEFENSAKEVSSNLNEKKTASAENKSTSIPSTKKDVGLDAKKEEL